MPDMGQGSVEDTFLESHERTCTFFGYSMFMMLTYVTLKITGGGPLDKITGDQLTEQGVNVSNIYGSSENGLQVPLVAGKIRTVFGHATIFTFLVSTCRKGLGIFPIAANDTRRVCSLRRWVLRVDHGGKYIVF
jgi:hypothetical protein